MKLMYGRSTFLRLTRDDLPWLGPQVHQYQIQPETAAKKCMKWWDAARRRSDASG